jgi:hypothetical protein
MISRRREASGRMTGSTKAIAAFKRRDKSRLLVAVKDSDRRSSKNMIIGSGVS